VVESAAAARHNLRAHTMTQTNPPGVRIVRYVTAALPVALTLLAACQRPVENIAPQTPDAPKDYSRQLPPGDTALRKVPPERYPQFGPAYAHQIGLRDAVTHSLLYLARPSSRGHYPVGPFTHERVVRTLEHFLAVIDDAQSPAELEWAIRRDFDVYESVGCDGQGTVYFTGYYCPIFEGRAERQGEFRYPLYGLPPDLVKDEAGRTLGARLPDGRVDPAYPTRQQIEQQRLLDGHEIAWVRSPIEAYIIHVQGSARLRRADGSIFEIGYAGNNGRPYTSITAAMVEDGVIGRDEISLQTIRDYFRQNPTRFYPYAWRNDRFVFFQKTAGGPYGSLNVPVTPLRTIATDKSIFPRGGLTFIVTDLPSNYAGQIASMRHADFALDQDTGGAIRAAGRCDIFVGIGPEAEALAGRAGAEGRLYYLLVKE
jgi:membrane-bound lytic murein transglycosylase A